MRILVLQLARFGDIYQTWPALRALKRKNPTWEVHVLVRERFRDAMSGFDGVTVHALPTQQILRPIIEEANDETSHDELLKFIEPLRELRFQRIINLSFSPLSSFLTDFLAEPEDIVRGYTRHPDGHLQIPDDTSAYFYAQVGIGRANRYHLTEIFASICEADLASEDYTLGVRDQVREGIVVHLGASQAQKTYPPELWVQALQELNVATRERLILVGSAEERKLANYVYDKIANSRTENRVGETSLPQLFSLLARTKLLIGADSAPIHIATLTGTRVLNLSSAQVNFWETGPVTPGSRVLFAKDINAVTPTSVCSHAIEMLEGKAPGSPCFMRETPGGFYRPHEISTESFTWQLIEALYTGSPYPEAETSEDRLAFQRLYELAELALQQLDRWSLEQAKAGKIMEQIDQLIPEVAKLNERVKPVVEWFQTQRLRIPPLNEAELLHRTRSTFEDLLWVCSVYRRFGNIGQELKKAILLCRECVPELREYAFQRVHGTFQTLLSTAQELARHQTKVVRIPWASVLAEINGTLERQDFICLADILQWKLVPMLEAHLNETETLSQEVLS